MSRFVFMILDGVGAGALPDAEEYGDAGASTLGNLARLLDLELPNLKALGLGNLLPLPGVPPVARPLALPGRLAERSQGKDTTTGHWEHMGVITEVAFRTYPEGFPEEVLRPFREQVGRNVLGNKPASGTEIIAELGEEHLLTGDPIVYTSADSVFQIAAHVEVVPLEELYRWCALAREIMTGEHTVARIIARPFTGQPGAFVRTKDRRDFSLEPPQETYLDLLSERGVPVLGLGKIFQIYAGRGVPEEHKVASNDDNLAKLLSFLREGRDGLLMTNLVDFDMVWGHRNDLEGFAGGLAAVDAALPEILGLLGPADRLLITADHGVDPTTVSTDHTREYVPLLYYPRPPGAPGASYEGWMSDSGATVFEYLTGEEATLPGVSLVRLRPGRGWRRYPPLLPGARVLPCTVGPEEAEQAAVFLRERLGRAPDTAIILGSGMDSFVESLVIQGEVPYAEIPHWPRTGVAGHAGRLLLGSWENAMLAVLRGRLHGYEGFDSSELQLAVRSLARWGVRRLVLTNASGGLAPGLRPGEVAVIREILDFHSPALGGDPDRLAASDPEAVAALTGPGGRLRAVTYVALPGPQYETAAEVAVLRALGGDTVGMSTAAEVRAAREEGLQVVALTAVTNPAGASAKGTGPVHEEVLSVGRVAAPEMIGLVASLLRFWGEPANPPAGSEQPITAHRSATPGEEA